MDLIRFGRDMYTIARLNQTLTAWGVRPTSRYHLDTHEAVLQMVANGVGWTIMPPLAICRALDRGAALRTAPYPELSMRRTISLVFRPTDGVHLAQRIHAVATGALLEHFLPQVGRLMPEVADQVTLHGLPHRTCQSPA